MNNLSLRKTILFFTTCWTYVFVAFSQENDVPDYYNEYIIGATTNTNSDLFGGIFFQYGRHQRTKVYESYILEFVDVKHPREYKVSVAGNSSSSRIWGKKNYLTSVRLQYRREKHLFKKAYQQGVQLSFVYGGGLSIGVISPYNVRISTGIGYISVPFDPDIHTSMDIVGDETRFYGLGSSSVALGFHAKTGLAFEFGAFKNSIVGIEVSLVAEAFTKRIVLVPADENTFVFFSPSFSFFLGFRN